MNHTIWTPKLYRLRDTFEHKYRERWTNFSCSFGDHVPRKIGELPDIHYTEATTSRIHFKHPSRNPGLQFVMPTTRFGSSPMETPHRGILPDLPTAEYQPYKYS